MKINAKSEKGAITLVVLVGMLLLTTFLMGLYIKISNKAQTSEETTKQVEKQYNNIGQISDVYDEYLANTDVVPIYTKEQLAKIGSNEEVLIDGKVYTFSSNSYYILKNDLELGGIYDESTDTWSGETWTPITNNFTGTLDGLGHKITGIYLGENEKTEGIFKNLNGTIKNVYVKNSYKVKNMWGLLAGTNNGEIINSYYKKALIGLKAGDYVNYTPTTGTYTVASGENGSGYTENQSFTTDATLKWRIWSIDEETGEVELISATVANNTLYLQGADGYNHGVDILNDLCKALYSNTNGATARSINVEDINAKTTYDYTTYSKTYAYGKAIRLSEVYGTDKMNYPNLYSKEKGYGTANAFLQSLGESTGLKDGVINEDGVTLYSTVKGSIDGNTAGTDPYVTFTFYSYNPEDKLKSELGINTAPIGLIKLEETYWLASRCVYVALTGTDYNVRIMQDNGLLYAKYLFGADGLGTFRVNSLRPIVSLNSNTTFTKDKTSSTNSVTYWNIKY